MCGEAFYPFFHDTLALAPRGSARLFQFLAGFLDFTCRLSVPIYQEKVLERMLNGTTFEPCTLPPPPLCSLRCLV
ncbi:unnamed protein product [Ectocarpus sp. 8 AP-2014]